MKNGEDARTAMMDEEVLPPISWVQDTKHKPWMSLKKRISLLKGLRDTFGAEEALEVIGIPEREALAKNKQRKAVASEFLEAAKAVPGKGYGNILQSACFHKDTETLEYWKEFEETLALTAQGSPLLFEDARATMKDSEGTAVKTMVRFVPSQQ